MPRLTPNRGRFPPDKKSRQTMNGAKCHAIEAQQNESTLQRPRLCFHTAIPPSPSLPEPQVFRPCQWMPYNASRRYIPGDLHVGKAPPGSGVSISLSYLERETRMNFRLQRTMLILSKRCLSLQDQHTNYNAGIA
jgi:hypothetical protein